MNVNDYTSSAVSSFENARLNKIIKECYDQVLNIASYNQYTETIRDEKKSQDRQKIYQATKTKIKNLFDQVDKEIKSLAAEIYGIKYPNLSKATNGVVNEKLYGAVEYNNALLIIKERPKNIGKILKEALEQNRFDFLFATAEGLLNMHDLPQAYKLEIDRIMDALKSQMGFDKLEEKKRALDYEFVEIKDYLNLITESFEMFEAKAIRTLKTARILAERGELEGESILVK